MESIPFPLSTFHLAALNTMENINIYIYTYLYLCTYGGQIDLLVLDNKTCKELYDLNVFI